LASFVQVLEFKFDYLFSAVANEHMLNPLTISVPAEFQTRRLVIRTFNLSDAPALHEALVESIDQLRQNLWFLPWVAEEQTIESAEIRCRKAHDNFVTRADLAYLAFSKETKRLVASVGLHRTDWSIPKTEVGYWVRSSEVGRGYASECVTELTNWALQSLGAARVELVTDELNEGSRAVAKRCGFELEGVHQNTMRDVAGKLRNSCVYSKLPS
jgi:RimJ/RimL family protein N-acetyltransferase